MANPFFDNEELNNIENEINEIQMDLSSNTNTILIKPLEMKMKIDNYLQIINQNEQRLMFFKKSNIGSDAHKKIIGLEKKIAILKNQLELNVKMMKK